MKDLSERAAWRAVVCVVVLFSVIEYGPVFLSGKIPFPSASVNSFPPYIDTYPPDTSQPTPDIGDLPSSFYPYRALTSRAIREGSLPLWNPYFLSGAPFVGNTQSAVFYPPNFLYFFMNVKRAWALEFVIERLLAALFTVLLVRAIGGTPLGALVSALLFAFSGFLTAWQGQAMADTVIWLPLICYAVVRLRDRPTRRSVAITAVAFAMPVLAGHPETAAHLTLTGSLVFLTLMFAPSSPGEPVSRLRVVKFFAAAGILSIGLSCVQILPTVEWLQNMHRSLATVWPSLPPWTALAFVSRDMMRAVSAAGLSIPENAAYIGTIAFIAIPLALLHPSKKLIAFLFAGTLALLSIVYGIGPLSGMLTHVPVLMGLKQWRLIAVTTFGFAVLSGLGISTIERIPDERGNRRWLATILVGIGFSVALAMMYALHTRNHEFIERLRSPRSSVLFLLACSLVIFAKLLGRLRMSQFRVLIVIVVALDVLTYGYGYVPFVHTSEVYPQVRLFDRLKAQPGPPFRIGQLDIAYVANSESVYGLRTSEGYEIPVERMARFLEGVARDEGDAEMFDTASLLKVQDRRADMLNTRYLLIPTGNPASAELQRHTDHYRFAFTEGNVDVLENLKALPAAFIVPESGVEIISGQEEQLARVKNPAFNPETSVVLGEADSLNSSHHLSGVSGSGVEWLHQGTNDFELKVNAADNGVLVVSQIYYPGWKADIEGQPVPVISANYALTAIHVPAGQYKVHFVYAPASIRIGATASALSLFVIAGLWCFPPKPRQTRQ